MDDRTLPAGLPLFAIVRCDLIGTWCAERAVNKIVGIVNGIQLVWLQSMRTLAMVQGLFARYLQQDCPTGIQTMLFIAKIWHKTKGEAGRVGRVGRVGRKIRK